MPASLEIERRGSFDKDHVGAGRTLEWPLVRLAPARPRDRGAVGIGRIRGGQKMRRRALELHGLPGVAQCPEAIHGSRQRELRGSQPFDEIPAPDPAGFFHSAQHRVDGTEAAGDVLRRNGIAGQDSVALQQRGHHRVEPLRSTRGHAHVGTIDEGPAADSLRRSYLQPARSRAALFGGPSPAQRPQRRKRVVGDLACPDQIPQGIEQIPVAS